MDVFFQSGRAVNRLIPLWYELLLVLLQLSCAVVCLSVWALGVTISVVGAVLVPFVAPYYIALRRLSCAGRRIS